MMDAQARASTASIKLFVNFFRERKASMRSEADIPQEPPPGRKELFDLLLSRLDDFVFVLADTAGNFISWHPGVQCQFGYTEEEFIGKNLEMLLPPAERLRGAAKQELERAAKTGRASDTRWLVDKNGQCVFVEGVTIALRAPNGALLAFGKVLRDVSEQKNASENQRALASALEQSTVMVQRFDGAIEHWTEACEHLYGWTAPEAVGKITHDLLKTTFPKPLEKIERELLVFGTWQGELEQIRRDGREVFVSAHWALLPDADGPPAIIATHADITPRVKVQRELEQANERLKSMALELERSNQELEEFARIASHDLGAPITSTRWLVDLLSSRHADQLDSEGKKRLKQISQGLERMADLVEGILTHAQVGTSAIASSTAIDAEQALAVAVENLRGDVEKSGAVITHDPLPEVRIDSQTLAQLFQNLLSNALKYKRPDTPPVVNVTATREGLMWLLAVRDNGMGIEPEWLERVFQPLQRRHGIEIAGSGIGLATCKKIVSRAGGRIWAESQAGCGSTFFFTLPGPESPREERDSPAHNASNRRDERTADRS